MTPFTSAMYNSCVNQRPHPLVMAVLLRDTAPPFRDVLKLGRECALVYGLMWQSAAMDERGNAGGTTQWTTKGLSLELKMHKGNVIKGLRKLVDTGFIQHIGWIKTGNGYKRLWRVTHPTELAAVRHAIDIMGPPSEKAYYNTAYGAQIDDKDEVSEERQDWKVDFRIKPDVAWEIDRGDPSGLESDQRSLGGNAV